LEGRRKKKIPPFSFSGEHEIIHFRGEKGEEREKLFSLSLLYYLKIITYTQDRGARGKEKGEGKLPPSHARAYVERGWKGGGEGIALLPSRTQSVSFSVSVRNSCVSRFTKKGRRAKENVRDKLENGGEKGKRRGGYL